MMNALSAITSTIITFCTAFNRFGNAADHLGRYVEGGAKHLADKAEQERAKELAALTAPVPSAPKQLTAE